jgi:hypothetical protein
MTVMVHASHTLVEGEACGKRLAVQIWEEDGVGSRKRASSRGSPVLV